MSSLRLCGLEDSVTEEDVKNSVAEAGQCSPREVHTGRWTRLRRSGMRNVVVQCPSRAAIKIMDAGAKVTIG
jgi:hypothetical protein